MHPSDAAWSRYGPHLRGAQAHLADGHPRRTGNPPPEDRAMNGPNAIWWTLAMSIGGALGMVLFVEHVFNALR